MSSFLDLSHYFPVENIRAGFSLRSFPFSPPRDRIELAHQLQLNSEGLVLPEQVHSGNVKIITNPGKYHDTDGVIAAEKSVVLSIQVADCIPLFFVDSVNKNTGLIHAGWRGITKNIIENGVNKIYELGTEKESLHVLIGPSIRECCYEVGPEVAKQFEEKNIRPGKGDRSFLDLLGVVENKLISLGIPQKQITMMIECTQCRAETYHSYRRDGEKSGRMIAMLGWRN